MKRILMIATGGTIACVETESGLVPGLSGEELLGYVPEAAGLCQLGTQDLFDLDSTNVEPKHWLAIAHAIADAYDRYDGFLVTHGTDTMAYTAAGLSYLVQGSPKPIVLTGAQLPISNALTDAKRNLYDSLLYLADDDSRDVSLVFGGAVIAGTRASKRRTASPNAFESVNFPNLATLRRGQVLRTGTLKGQTVGPLRMYDQLDTRVQLLKLVPGMDPGVFDALAPYCDALVVEGFGLGGIPSTPAYRRAVFDWLDSGRIMVAASQTFEEGFDMSVYEVGRAYVERGGMLMSGDMTCEAMVAKLMWALGQTRDRAEVERLFLRTVNHDRLML
ncbi:MAG: asparaginase [Eggerthellaceae bacterium]|nr:asparaginase [Eggerthellaceae bacterium]